MPFVIGLTGPIASGKDIASKFLINKGYIYYSLSQVVREEADSRNIKKDREDTGYSKNGDRSAGGE